MRLFWAMGLLVLAGVLLSNTAIGQGAQRGSLNTNYTAVSSTEHDFTDTMIDGQTRAPEGFFLQGRKGQSLSQMVRLRSNFKRELRHSRSGMKAVVK